MSSRIAARTAPKIAAKAAAKTASKIAPKAAAKVVAKPHAKTGAKTAAKIATKSHTEIAGQAQTQTPPAEDAFYISASASAARSRRSLKHNDTFAVLDTFGDMGAAAGTSDGLFHCDTRFLSRLQLLVDEKEPLLLGSTLRDDNAALVVDLTNPDMMAGQRVVLEKDTLHVLRTTFLWRDTAYQRLGVRNYCDRTVTVRLSILFASDFADLFEVRGAKRARRGTATAQVRGNDQVLLDYRGLDDTLRRTTLTFDPPPAKLSTNVASFDLELAPGEACPIFVAVGCNQAEPRPVPFLRALIRARREPRQATAGRTSVETSNDLFNEMLCRSAADLQMLMTDTPQGRYPYAGIPWFSTTFGRDGLITALQMLWWSPDVARGVLRRLAAYQAKTTDPLADAEPGKIVHEMRGGEMAALREVPFGLYYGSVDSTPLFVLLAGLYLERTGDVETIEALWPAIEAALDWIAGPGDPDGDGFVEYLRASEHGLANQGWKDSYDAIFHADGRLAEGAIALAEVQGYVYAAKRMAARCARRIGRNGDADRLDAQATKLAAQFEAAFWCPQIETYALALDGAKTPCAVRTSNAGQVLFTGIADPERARLVARGLLRSDFFSGWGIRTVAIGEARYNPMSYHNGSIWPHDNALIALGLARYGLKRPLDTLFEGMFQAGTYMDHRRLPELFCGFRRQHGHGPTLYPVANAPQAWAAATPFALLQACLGLEFDPFTNEIRLSNPRLPSFLEEVTLHNLQLGSSYVDLRVRRHHETVSLDTPRINGGIQVSIVHSC
jgi:glycogen debranching enzyme